MSGGVADLYADPGCIAPGTDVRKVRRAPDPEFAKAMADDAALPDEHLSAAARARPRCDDRTGKQAEADFSCHGVRLYAKGRS